MPTSQQITQINKLKELVSLEKTAIDSHIKGCDICPGAYCAGLNVRKAKLIMAENDLRHYTRQILRFNP